MYIKKFEAHWQDEFDDYEIFSVLITLNIKLIKEVLNNVTNINLEGFNLNTDVKKKD